MHLKLNFKKMKNSKELTDYIEHRFEKLQKYEMKPVSCTMTLCVEGGVKSVDIHAVGEQKSFQAHGESGNFFESIDLAVDRLAKQMMKKKSKVQNHKCYENTHQGKIDKFNDTSDWDSSSQYDDMDEVA